MLYQSEIENDKLILNLQGKMMNKLDISNWKEFKISELFKIEPTNYHKLINKDLLDVDGINPVVVNSSYNNGIGGYSFHDCTEEGNTITFSDTTTADSIFYQPNDLLGILTFKNLSLLL
ncbi:Uncharacterised protein [Actinobacillus equuli]|nr:Uncharacterised protein [Actinobacillus equuli]